ncbi:thioredoxin family protein [Candidatus Marinarcus aquaticus]|uniref:DUF255 domain-containing protein n=1 Tax=Candidatus Marinarcus aquaticus TaxID=2044504 RepID=A0A4Q0XWJ5_9BACT|nr:thioredoxin family protein [Candidatus Marinarcus aquaticus]RXJ60629.1 hypothetical protein CRV04_01060 [Candidatus Marinarcus aquaticus]
MYKGFILLFLLFSTLFAQPLETLSSYDAAIKKGLKENKRVLMLIYSDYCSWCEKMQKKTLSNEKVVAFIQKDFVFVKINREKGEYPKEFIPRFIPTTYLIDPKSQEEIYALYGYKTATQFLDELSDE